nr:hypothetical protein [Tanacetum cinerariifolium]
MSTQQDIYEAGSENRPPMLNKENYVPWSSRLLRYAKSRPNGKLIHNSIINGPYVRRMIPEPGDPNREVLVNETFHVQTDDELTEKELKQIETDDQAIQTILLGLPEDIYTAIDSCKTAQETWLRVQQMIKGSDIGIQEKKAKLFNEWGRFTSTDGELIESYYHQWSRDVTIVHQTKDLHTLDYTQLYDFLKYNQKEVDDLKAERLAKTQETLALMETLNNPYTFPVLHQDQPSFNQNYMQQPMPNPKDITDPTTAMNMALALMAKEFKLNYSTTTRGFHQTHVIGRLLNRNAVQNPRIQNVGNQNGQIVVPGNANQNPNVNGNLVAARAEGSEYAVYVVLFLRFDLNVFGLVVVDKEILRDDLTASIISNQQERFDEIERVRFAFKLECRSNENFLIQIFDVEPIQDKRREVKRDYCCSKGSPRDKIICDLNKTPDLSQRPLQNCPKCRHPVNCRGCALLRKKFKEDLFTYYIENEILKDSSKPSNDNTNVVNALQELFVVNQDPGAHYGYNCPPKVSIIPDPEPLNNQTIDELPQPVPNKFIKYSVENLLPNPSECEGEYECDVPACEDFTTFSNILFDADYDFSFSDDQSFYDEDILKKIYSNPLFDEEIISMKIDLHHLNAESDLIESLLNHDSSINSPSSKNDSLFDEFVGELTLLKSIPPGINGTDCNLEEEIHLIKRLLYDNSSPHPPEEFISENSDTAFESFSPSFIPVEDSDSLIEEIDLSFTPDNPMPPGIKEDDYDSKRDILILE